ncbi:MAG: 50S ribosomal protein L13 [Candidatus Colwellbacteria bacterium]|nr:50S ribosomal protein L13 [Candidatus Colwellbacteria bacterium]
MEYTIDAAHKRLGIIASRIATLLQGKDAVSYEQNRAGTNVVVVTNIRDIDVTGRKLDSKVFYRHSGYIGSLKETTLGAAMQKDPAWVLRHAVRGMLPANRLRAKRLKRLIIQT